MNKSFITINLLLLNKYLKTNLIFVVLGLFLFKNTGVSQNLIQNTSFEIYTNPVNCSGASGGFYNYASSFPYPHVLNNWEPISSPDYFVPACNGANNDGSPLNIFGYSLPKNGSNYVGFTAYGGAGSEIKEYFYQQFTTPMQGGKSYCLSFYVSLADASNGAIKQVGAFFCNTLPNYINSHIVANAQVVNQNGFITDTLNWTNIQGCYNATGGEQYVVFGNFNDNATTDTVAVNTDYTLADGFQRYSYYYIDDISLVEDLTSGLVTSSAIENPKQFNLYPNPNNGTMLLDYNLGENNNTATVELVDVTGKLINNYNIQTNKGTLTINEQALHNGIYFYRILVGDKLIKTNKVVIIK